MSSLRTSFADKEDIKNYYVSKGMYLSVGLIGLSAFCRDIEYQTGYFDHKGLPAIGNISWSQYTLAPLPGCCGAVVYTGGNIWGPTQKVGLGTKFFKEAQEIMTEAGYSCGVCTVTSGMLAQIAILKKENWKMVHEFVNKRTNNTVQFWVKNF